MSTFEEQFPSLADDIDIAYTTYFGIEYKCVFIKKIALHCLDKQKVKEAIEERSCLCPACKDSLLEELGL